MHYGQNNISVLHNYLYIFPHDLCHYQTYNNLHKREKVAKILLFFSLKQKLYNNLVWWRLDRKIKNFNDQHFFLSVNLFFPLTTNLS